MILPALIAAVALATGQTPQATTARGTTVPVLPFPTGEVQTVNLIEWNSNQLPRLYERSDQLPLTDEEVAKLSKAGFTAPQLVKMLEERRCACDASADGLIRLKQAGVSPEVLSAISLHALPPNRMLNLLVTLDFTGASRDAREGFLYFFVEDGELTRVLSLNVPDLLRNQNAHDTMVDRSDILRARTVRRIQLPGSVPLKTYGPHRVLVAASASPTLTHPSQLTQAERARAQLYTFDYPRSSLQSLCRLTAGYRQDAVLGYKWRFEGSRFECEWN
ncbi:hypothetical protein [Hyalangium gracile]|uniref:hypothetical protein n=1 Tax=Hyalangium gracile TaxID=394092 RepID=UPI001CCF32AC|nr:hypothetical protein [Hyalangium gracile]